jgi:hypothetical protein
MGSSRAEAEHHCRAQRAPAWGINVGPLFWHPPIAARVLELLIRHLPEVSEAIDDEMAAQGLTQEVLAAMKIQSAVE